MDKNRDLLSGNLTFNIFKFTLPIILSSVLQLFSNAADLIVVGKFDAANASLSQAAIGTTTNLIYMLINFFIGISVGVNVLIARLYAGKRKEQLASAVQTSMFLGAVAGILVGVLGIVFSGKILSLMNVDADVFAAANIYLKIFFLGSPFIIIYNFGSAVMRASGDTKHPMIYLIIACVLNVILKLVTVIFFKMGVAGLAAATSISNFVSALLIVIKLLKFDDIIKLDLTKNRIKQLWITQTLSIGLPSGIQSSLFSLSSVIIQSAINSFGANATAGCGDAANIESFIYTIMNAYSVAAVTFVSQCCGVNKTELINRVTIKTLILVTATGVILGYGSYFAGDILLGIYTSKPIDIEYGMQRLAILATTYFLAGIMEVITGATRGMGQAIAPMIITLVFACGYRAAWIYLVFPKFKTLQTIFISYPISWVMTIIFATICYVLRKKKISEPKKTVDKSEVL